MSVDRRAASGFASIADAYERGRPSYPCGAIERIISGLRLSAASSVIDLAAGTGQLSRLLHTRVRRTLAVEPVAAMRAKIAAALPDVAVIEGTAEAIPLGQHEVDAVVVGEAFHWFRTAAATAEIARVRPPAAASRCCGTHRRGGPRASRGSSTSAHWSRTTSAPPATTPPITQRGGTISNGPGSSRISNTSSSRTRRRSTRPPSWTRSPHGVGSRTCTMT
jgi:ubiquinone/menaquinone biosynthesis C-methylase UbiE